MGSPFPIIFSEGQGRYPWYLPPWVLHFLQRSAIVAGSADELGVLKLINRTKACQSERKGKKMQKQEVGGMVKKKDGEKQNSLSGVY